ESVANHQLTELEEVRNPPGLLQRLIQFRVGPGNVDILPELFAQLRDELQCLAQSRVVARHATIIPHDVAQLAMNGVHGTLAVNREQSGCAIRDLALGIPELGHVRIDGVDTATRQIVADRVRNHEISVRQTLHERTRSESVGAVVREVRFAQRIKTGNGRHQIVVDPETAHGIMRRWVDTHRNLVRVLVGDALVHLEQITVSLGDGLRTESLDGIGKVEVHTAAGLTDTTALVAHLLCRAGRDVARAKITKRRILALQIIIPLGSRYFIGRTLVPLRLWYPHASIVAQRLAHQRELGLIVAAHGNARWMDLRVARIRERRPSLVRTPDGGRVAAARVGGQVEDVAVTTSREHDGVRRV